jgi:putative membrane protein
MTPWGLMPYSLGGVVLWMVIAAIVVVIIVAIVGGSKTGTGVRETPLDILKKRYAQGEISKQEFDKIKKDIT